MNRKYMRIAAVAVAIAGLLASGVAAQSTATPELAMNGDELIELIDQALYLASAGMSGYGQTDVRILAQSLVNVFEGSGGEHYDDTSATVVSVGIMFHPLMAFTSDWVTWFQSLPGSEATLAVEALANVNVSLEFAYDAALSLLQDDDEWFGHAYSWFLTYAALLAAKGDVDDPLLLPGIEQLAALDLGTDTMEMEGSEATLVLQTAIQDATESGFVMLEAGVYRGDPTILTQDITIYGVSPEETILEGTFWVPFIQILADEPITVRLQNLTIRGGVTALSTAFTGDASARITLELENVHFVSNESGIWIGHPTKLTAHNCLFQENQTAVRVSPVGEGGLSSVELNACEFLKNETAVSARGGDTVTLRYCRILDGTDPDVDISIADGAVLRMSDCVLERVAGGGIRIAGSAFATLTNNTITTPYAYGIAVGPSSEDDQDCGRGFASDDEDLPPGEVTGHGNTIDYGICPFTLDFLIDPAPQEVIVSAGESVQTAIDAIADGGTIYVEPGSYHETLVIAKSVSLAASSEDESAILEVGEGMTGIIVRGDTVTEVNLSAITIEGIGTGVGIDVGESGVANLHQVTLRHLGTGVHVHDGGRVRAVNVDLTNNGMAVSARLQASFEAIGCTFADNRLALSACMSSVCSLTSCTIEGCTSESCAITSGCSELKLSYCTIRDNRGPGVALAGGVASQLHMVDCDLSANEIGLELMYGGCNPGDPDWEGTPTSECAYGTISGWNNRFSGFDDLESDAVRNGVLYHLGYESIDISFLMEPKPEDE